tara:strand:+ start:1127 stop:1543 length:417 start_codon:yes stop_codon:yes gene_type:complete
VKKIIILICICITFSCENRSDIDLNLLNGYWEIQSVKQNNKLLKTYPFSGTIDYFELKENKGIRKKVNPKFDGKFITSMHQINFNIIYNNDIVEIEYYDKKSHKYKETITKLDSVDLYITNKDNYIYHYKVYEKLNLD